MQERDQYLLLIIPTKHGGSNEPAERVGAGLVFNAGTGTDAAVLADVGVKQRALACAKRNKAHQSPGSSVKKGEKRGREGLTHASGTRRGGESRFGLDVSGRGEGGEEGADSDGGDTEGEHGGR